MCLLTHPDMIKKRAARVEISLTCEECYYELKWGCYRPFGYDCSSCCSNYVAVVDPDWIPKYQQTGYDCSSCCSNYVAVVDPDWIPKCQQTGAESSFGPETMSCPYCGAWTEVRDGYGSSQCFVDCVICIP
ncbi:uncharacterized protein A4U43_C03F9240 [Asparagus officinalis]|uniref:Uncharacterized protein n=1 Tax=Asparagus officinalis TaxID=4686 RepID=A0A5P1FDT1_ASPOF|nr:uncharacterized protein A4U43_C03F9240 [Asparagus officinalis]